tara:strand:+ start:889 stop:1446 length:558 start_codon:yes stop_codon:yes gene_type:complete
MEKVEIELKFPLLNADRLIEKLKLLSEPKSAYQKDTYFIPAHRDFLKQTPINEWLRIREDDHGVSINYKHWHKKDDAEAISCDEFETGLQDASTLRKILEKLDFKEIIVVEKQRNNWNHKNVIVSVDRVAGLGDFIEVEFDGDSESIEEAKKHLLEVLREIEAEVGEQKYKGYPHLILEKKGYFS